MSIKKLIIVIKIATMLDCAFAQYATVRIDVNDDENGGLL